MARKGYMNNIQELSYESDSDYDLSYTLPRYATPSREETANPKPHSGTPERPIKIPDTKSAGTPDEPIWISDVDGTDTETDVSNAAVRGTRKSRSAGPVNVPPSFAFQTHEKKSRSKSREKKNESIESPKVLEDMSASDPTSSMAPVTTSKSPRMVPTRSRSPTKKDISHIALNHTSSEETPISTNTTNATIEKKVKSKSRMKPLSWRSSSKVSPNKIEKEPSVLSIDIASLAEEGEDPTLEKELEEIALNGRSGLISGTPAAHDIEKGKKQSLSSFVPPMAPLDEDEADRSWHNTISDMKPKRTSRQRWYLILSIAGLIAISACLIYVMRGNKKEPEILVTEANLTEKQKTMQNILERITDRSILNNANTPQYKARHWLLFRDRDLASMEEERIVQRYVLACLYFSTSGDEKWNENNWLTGDECASTPWTGLKCNDEGEVTAIVLGT